MSLKWEFPLFTHQPGLIYFDSAATSQKSDYVLNFVQHYLTHTNSNIHRGLYNIAVDSETLYHKSKKYIWTYINVPSTNIIYTNNATMWYNMIAQSLIDSKILQAGDHIILSVAEHHANIVPRQLLARKYGIVIDRLNLDINLQFDLAHLKSILTDRTKVVSVTACSNVLGIAYDLRPVRKMIWDRCLIADISQMIPHQTRDMQDMWVDICIFTGHKMIAYTGIWIIGMRNPWTDLLLPVRWGGDMVQDVTLTDYVVQEDISKFEPGTPSIISAISLLWACQYINQIWWYAMIQKIESDLAHLLNTLFISHNDHIHVIWDLSLLNRHIWSFVVDGWSPIRVAELCADHNICMRFGWHCAHPLIRYLWHTNGWVCRISTYLYNDDNDVQALSDLFDLLRQ